jgi:hypothetical protein
MLFGHLKRISKLDRLRLRRKVVLAKSRSTIIGQVGRLET